MKEIYDWVPWFIELAQKIADEDKNYLIQRSLQVNWREEGNEKPMKLFEYGDDNIDPFSFFYTLASWNTERSRGRVYSSVSHAFNLEARLPLDLGAHMFTFPHPIPQNLLFHNGGNGNPELLWNLFRGAVEGLVKIDDEMFNQALNIGNVDVAKLTQALFLINPKEFLPFDKHSEYLARTALKQNIQNLENYRNFISTVKTTFPGCHLYEVNTFNFEKIEPNVGRCYLVNAKLEGGETDLWDEFELNNYVYVRDQMAVDPDLLNEPEKGDVILVSSGSDRGRGIGIVYRNDYQNADINDSKLHLIWLNKVNAQLTGLTEVKEFAHAGQNIEAYRQLEEYEPTFRLMAERRGEEIQNNNEDSTMENPNQDQIPVNKIFYGPPGTGKTFYTAIEAVRLCGKPVPESREQLMKTYRELLEEGRIEFVTFHQSMSYEDFVEGRQPMTGSDEEDTSSSAGFRLETVPGIFRQIAKRAETSRGPSRKDDAITVTDRQVFKMSIGEANNPEDVHLFKEAIAGGYTLLGFEDIDWSDDKYADRKAIIEACKAEGNRDEYPDLTAHAGAV